MSTLGWRGIALVGFTAAAVFTVILGMPEGSYRYASSTNRSETQVFGDDPSEYLEPDADQGNLVNRIRLKEQISVALIREELTFSQAAQQFRELNRGDPTAFARLQIRYPGVTEYELSFRQVVSFVNGARSVYPDQVARLLPRLEAELRRLFQSRQNVKRAPRPHDHLESNDEPKVDNRKIPVR